MNRESALRSSNFSFQSGGPQCNAFDGSSDDAIALLNVTLDQIVEADSSRIVVLGLSRGCTIAHLVGQRDNRIGLVIASARLVDFHRKEADWYPFHACHFLDNMTQAESRLKMLASFPLHFAAQSAPTRIHHGKLDERVPLWNAEEMYSHLRLEGVDAQIFRYEAGHSLAGVPAFQQNVRNQIEAYLVDD